MACLLNDALGGQVGREERMCMGIGEIREWGSNIFVGFGIVPIFF